MGAVAVHMQGMNASSPAADAFDDLPLWSLNDLYSSPEDPKIEADFEAARLLVAELAQLKGAIAASRANPDRLGLVINQIVRPRRRATIPPTPSWKAICARARRRWRRT